MTSLVYSAGTVSVSNASSVVTGTGTAWELALVTGGMFSFAGMSVPILSVESNTSLTLAYPWPGANGSGAYAIARETSEAVRAAWINDRLARLMTKPWGTGVVPDGRGTLAERDALNPMPTDKYCWLREETGFDPTLYFKTPSGWIGPFPLTGEPGAPGPAGVLHWIDAGWASGVNYAVNDGLARNGSSYRCKVGHLSAAATEPGVGVNWATVWDVTAAKGAAGTGFRFRGAYSGATAYLTNDVTSNGGSSWIALQNTTGNAPPTLPTTANAYWELMVAKGNDGAGAITSVNGTSSGAVVVDQASVDAQSTLATTRGDAAYVMLATDRHVLLTAALTVARVWQLPAASAYKAGRRLVVRDAVGGVSSTNTLTIQRAGTDTIDGATTLVLDTPWEGAELVSNGTDAWSVMTASAGNTKARRRRSLGLDDTTAAPNVGDTFKWNGSLWVPAKAREVLTANRTYYVRTDGSNSNDGLANTAGGAFLTLQRAWDVVASLDASIYAITIKVGDGTYTAGMLIASVPVGGSSITIEGNTTTPGNCYLDMTSGNFRVISALQCPMIIRGFKCRFAGAGASAVALSATGSITTSNMELVGGSTSFAGAYYVGVQGANITISTGQTISGGMSCLAQAGYGSIQFFGITVTLTGTPAFSWATIVANNGGIVQVSGVTFSGAATGVRYNAVLAGGINTNGGGANFIPGSSAGSATAPGWYA